MGLKSELDGAGREWLEAAVDAMEIRAAARPSPAEVVLIVHGTWANEPSDKDKREVPWWRSHGSFAKELEAALQRHGSSASCRTPMSLEGGYDRYLEMGPWWQGWSGANSEVERRRGAYELSRQIRAYQKAEEVGSVHIVAHSHGGNVALRALRYLNRPTLKLGKVVCLGTPFLHFGDTAAWRRWLSRVHWPMLLVVAGLVALMIWKAEVLARSGNDISGVVAAALVAAGLHSIWRYARTSEATSTAAPATAVEFSHDEAIQLLRSCASLTTEPHLWLRDLQGGSAKRRTWVERKGARRSGFGRTLDLFSLLWRWLRNLEVALSNFWNGPVCRLAERATSLAYRLPLIGHLGTLGLIALFKPYRPKLRPFLASRMPRLKRLFFHTFEEEVEESMRASEKAAELKWTGPNPLLREFGLTDTTSYEPPKPWWTKVTGSLDNTMFDPKAWVNFVAGTAALLFFVLYPLDLLLGLPAWLGQVLKRFAIIVGADAAAAGAPGMDMLGAAFEPRKTGTPPERVTVETVPEAIERDISEQLSGDERIDLGTLRESLGPAGRANLLDALKAAFTDVGLLHAQYYRDPRVIDYVAQCIAGESSPEWVEGSDELAAEPPGAEPEPTD